MSNLIRTLFYTAAESTAVRLLALALTLGAVPFYLLSMAVASLGA